MQQEQLWWHSDARATRQITAAAVEQHTKWPRAAQRLSLSIVNPNPERLPLRPPPPVTLRCCSWALTHSHKHRSQMISFEGLSRLATSPMAGRCGNACAPIARRCHHVSCFADHVYRHQPDNVRLRASTKGPRTQSSQQRKRHGASRCPRSRYGRPAGCHPTSPAAVSANRHCVASPSRVRGRTACPTFMECSVVLRLQPRMSISLGLSRCRSCCPSILANPVRSRCHVCSCPRARNDNSIASICAHGTPCARHAHPARVPHPRLRTGAAAAAPEEKVAGARVHSPRRASGTSRTSWHAQFGLDDEERGQWRRLTFPSTKPSSREDAVHLTHGGRFRAACSPTQRDPWPRRPVLKNMLEELAQSADSTTVCDAGHRAWLGALTCPIAQDSDRVTNVHKLASPTTLQEMCAWNIVMSEIVRQVRA